MNQRIIAVGRSHGKWLTVATAPPDWPTQEEVDAIVSRLRRINRIAACVQRLFDPDDWAAWAPDAEHDSERSM